LASNISNNEINEVYRNSKPNDKNLVYEKEKLDCPNNIRKYAQSSRGVDYLDQMMSYYSTEITVKNIKKFIIGNSQ